MKIKACLFVIILFTAFNSFSQELEDFSTATDAIFKPIETKDKPGIASGIIKEGKVIYLKGFGIANLETGETITPQTKFQVDDLAKQFTVLAFLLLEEQGKISWEDDIRKHIPQLPLYKESILLKHVLNNTTGLNEYTTIKSLIGSKPNDVFSHKDAMNLIITQKELNFSPGSDFSFRASDTEITLMAEIISKASGMSLPAFAEAYIFKKLNMQNTLFSDDYETIIPNLAKSYQATENGFKEKRLNTSNAGPTNLFISVEDLAIWYTQFSEITKNELSATIKKLHKSVRLDYGETKQDSWGKMSWARDFIHLERGVPMYWQFGLTGGYGANMFIFPELDIVSFAIGNNNQYNGYYAMTPLEPLLNDYFKRSSIVDFNEIKTKKLSTKKLKKFEGHYWSAKGGVARTFYVKNDTLRRGRLGSDMEDTLIPLSDNKFQMVVESDDLMVFEFTKTKTGNKLHLTFGESDPYVYHTYKPVDYSINDLQQFTGIFYNENLNITYTLNIEDGKLKAYHFKNGIIEFTAIMKDVFTGNQSYFKSIEFLRKDNNIEEFKVLANGIGNLNFKKIN